MKSLYIIEKFSSIYIGKEKYRPGPGYLSDMLLYVYVYDTIHIYLFIYVSRETLYIYI